MVYAGVPPMNASFPPIAALFPHGPAILMLDALDAWEPRFVQCSTQVREDSPFVENGTLSSLITLEHLAQTIATYLGYEAHLRGKGPSIGMVVAVRNYRLFRPSIAVGEQLVLRATMTQGDTERSQFEGEVLSKGECVARGVLTLVRARDLPAKTL